MGPFPLVYTGSPRILINTYISPLTILLLTNVLLFTPFSTGQLLTPALLLNNPEKCLMYIERFGAMDTMRVSYRAAGVFNKFVLLKILTLYLLE